MLPVISNRVFASRIDDQRAIHAHRLLHVRMAVVPIGAVLLHREFVSEAFARRDAGIAHAWNSIHLEGKQHPMPVH